jgi:hypothetical protein
MLKQTLPAPQNNGVNHEPILINQVMLHQRLDKITTAKDQNVLTRLLLQLGYFLGNIPFDQACIPLNLLQGLPLTVIL